MKIPRKSRRFLELTAALDAEFARLGRPAIPGQSADYLAESLELVAGNMGMDPAYVLRVYFKDDWPSEVAAKVVANLEDHDTAIAETAAVELTLLDALKVAMHLGIAADWTLRVWASTLLEARNALPATGPLHKLLHDIVRSDEEPILFGGRDLADARLSFVATIPRMRNQLDCDCTHHERVPGQPCATMTAVAGNLLESLHLIGGAMPAPDQERHGHPLDGLFEDYGLITPGADDGTSTPNR
jgi:hypothetical protein